ncbi:glycosyl hydrolase family 18 protein [Anaerocolumna xylanovorans]|uniref:Copper amine oxidase N-terminal domain-containing protein n=1 Tax=Anaerocolumna xylanovorans DSM 12503 TaxID=1121345 RepID=A0A1M7Y9T4_9FIRM|nr:glycosyl hydrolase family 18 protein [Anaerocolumna xylanovorans]SHO49394.1 Copper amine oxidase N-terminal domain-containing protein [Anaerocolumna xylanovorans DSM 12503]
MRRQRNMTVAGIAVALIILLVIILSAIVKKFTPSNEHMALTDYYHVKGEEVQVVLQDTLYEKQGILKDGQVYLDYNTVADIFNKRFYWDSNENILSYTTPTEIIRAEIGNSYYNENNSQVKTDYQPVIMEDQTAYVAIDFVKQYSDMSYTLYKDPSRVVIGYKWGDVLTTKTKKKTQLRYKASIKSDILKDLKEGEEITLVDTSEATSGKFYKVITEDGVIGYVKAKKVAKPYYTTLKSSFKAPSYSHITQEGKINLVWHQVTNKQANGNLLSMLEGTKGVTCVSPTWFKLSDNAGGITSLASESYVERAHNLGIQVWALVDDFSTDVDKKKVLSSTSSRKKLVNELIAETIKYGIDGINIDFEKIPQEAGEDFIQFIRELSVKCRSNGIVLSIDNYVPASYNSHYNWEEQGEVADYVIVMAYDEHHSNSEESGSVSSVGYVKEAVSGILKSVPKERVIMGLPFYTRLWKETKDDDGTVKITSEAYGMNAAQNLLTDNGVTAKWDNKTEQYYGEFEKDGALYKMWLEEEDSFEAKLKVIAKEDIAGIAGWKLGLEKDNIWNVITKYIN